MKFKANLSNMKEHMSSRELTILKKVRVSVLNYQGNRKNLFRSLLRKMHLNRQSPKKMHNFKILRN